MAIVDLTNRISAEREPRHTDLTTDEFRLFSEAPGQIRKRFVARSESGNPVASLSTNYADDRSNPRLLRVSLSVAPDHRRRGIGSQLLAKAAEIARDLERSTLTGEVFDTVQAGNAFLAAIGGRRTLEHHLNSLKIAELDSDLLREWVEQGPRKAPGYSVRLIDGNFPDDLLEGMAHLYLVLERDMPTPEEKEPREWTPRLVLEFMEHFLQGTEALTAVAITNETGEAAGMSQLIRRKADPTTWQVTTTMVDPEHRGHSLGKWIKGAVNLEALAKWPGAKYQETGNASTNEAMLRINHAMGFEHELTQAEVVVEVERVEEYLASRKD
ncbi:MAG: GNAT family N-acetyltransferase [Acidimicrobiia bacterium]